MCPTTIRLTRAASLLLLTLGLTVGCGGGGGGGGGTTTPPTGVSISGSVTKGAIGNAEINIYSLNSDGSRGSRVAGPFTSDSTGRWSGRVPSSAVGPFEVVATGGSYTDEATGSVVSLAIGEELSSMVQNNPGTPISAAVTPYSHALTRSAMHMVQSGGVALGDAVGQVISNATNTFGFDPTTTVPPDPNNVPANASDAERRYAALLGGISRLGDDAITNHATTAASRLELALALAQDMADGVLDGLGIDGNPITLFSSTGGNINLPALDNGGLGALITQTNSFIASVTNLTGTDVGTLPGDLVTPPPAGIVLVTPVNGATLAQATEQGAVNLTLSVALSNYRLIDGRSWQLFIDGQPNETFNTLIGNIGTTLSAGQHTLTARLNDASGAPLDPEVSASSTITVTQWTDLDLVAPVVSAPTNIVVAAAPGATSVAASDSAIAAFLAAASASDDRDGDLSQSVTHNAPTSFPVGVTTVTFSVSDAAGNSATATATVTVTPTTLNYYAIKGSVTGLVSGSVTWELWVESTFNNDGGSGNGTFQAAASVADGSHYQLTLNSQPSDHTCTLGNASGTVAGANVTVTITCAEKPPLAPVRFDLSGYSFTPSLPNITPTAPAASAVNPSDKIAALYAEFVANERARIFGPAPANLTRRVASSVYMVDGDYALTESVGGTDEWTRQLNLRFGPDGLPLTGDDQLVSYAVAPNGTNGVIFGFNHPGVDGVWFTEDDVGGSDYYGDAVYIPSGVAYEFNGTQGAILIITSLEPGDDGLPFTADDQPNSYGYQLVLIDGAGHRGEVVTYTSAGSDGLWFTADDTPKLYSLASFDAGGNLLQTTTYNAKGTDNTWFTADDTVQLYIVNTLDANYRPNYAATFNNKGSDGTWFTADDVVSAYSYYGYDADGNLLLLATHTYKGADGTWFTADDSASALVNVKDADGRTQLTVTLTGMGADGIWLTGDESTYGYSYMEYDDAGHQVRSVSFNAAGADGKWLTADDVPNTYNFWTRLYDASGNMLQQVYYNGAGADGQVFTADDTASQYTVRQFDANGNTTATVYIYDMGADGIPFTADDQSPYQLAIPREGGSIYATGSPGPDGTWFTADDPRSGYIRVVNSTAAGVQLENYTYDGTGPDGLWDTEDDQLASYGKAIPTDAYGSYNFVYYGAPGTDGVWFTADDEVSSYSYNTVDGNGNLSGRTTYYLAGEDGLWFTADDPISSTEHYEYEAGGRLLVAATAYSSGTDGLWGTLDDYTGYSAFTYDASGTRTRTTYYNGIGADAIWFSADDLVQSITYERPVAFDAAQTAYNTGSTLGGCTANASASGVIGVLVVDQEGAALAGVTAQLDQSGATATTDASGFAEFSGLTGGHDLHLFKDGYSWESFYCVEPANGLVIQGQLNSTATPATTSQIKLTLNTTNLDSSNIVELRLLDAQGNELARNKDILLYSSTVDLTLPVAAGTQVTGNLWAFEVAWYGSTYKVFDGVLVGGTAQTFTTEASGSTTRTAVDINFAATNPEPVWLSSSTQLIRPEGYQGGLALDLGGLLPLPVVYESSQGRNYASLPSSLDGLFSVTGVTIINGNNYTTSSGWEVQHPLMLEGGSDLIDANFTSSVLFGPAFSSQKGLADANPQLSWTPLRLVSQGSHGGYLDVELVTYVSALSANVPLWTLHLPAGADGLTLPSRPAGLSVDHLSKSSFILGLEEVAVKGLDYQTLISSRDLHDPLPASFDLERFPLDAVGRYLTR